jgi:hypothetical protein
VKHDRGDLNENLRVLSLWGAWEPLKALLTRKFPLLNRVGFHLCAPRHSNMHFRRGLRRSTERRIKEYMDQMARGEDVAEYLEVEWFDSDYSPIAYDKKNGKPSWKGAYSSWIEPETEASDCDSEEWESDF